VPVATDPRPNAASTVAKERGKILVAAVVVAPSGAAVCGVASAADSPGGADDVSVAASTVGCATAD
jgi:hypothetical protein